MSFGFLKLLNGGKSHIKAAVPKYKRQPAFIVHQEIKHTQNTSQFRVQMLPDLTQFNLRFHIGVKDLRHEDVFQFVSWFLAYELWTCVTKGMTYRGSDPASYWLSSALDFNKYSIASCGSEQHRYSRQGINQLFKGLDPKCAKEKWK